MGEKKNENKKGDGEKKEKGLTVTVKAEGLCKGVKKVKADVSSNKVTLIVVVDPIGIRKKPEKKTKPGSDNKPERNPNQARVTTAILKVQFECQCDGCSDKIRKVVSVTKGVHELKLDQQKGQVTVKGTMNVEALAKDLNDKLNKKVEIVRPKKEKAGKIEGGDGKGQEEVRRRQRK